MAKEKKLRYNRVVVYLALVMLAIAVFFSLTTSTFFSLRNFFNFVESYSVTGIFAMGLLVVLVTGGIDISFLATASVVQYVTVLISKSMGMSDSFIVGILLAIALGVCIGLINGALIYYLAIVSIIVTISMQSIMFGGLMYSSSGRSIYNLPEWMYKFSGTALTLNIGDQRYPVSLAPFVMIVMAVVTYIILKVLDAVMGLRVTEEEEAVGLDLAQHNERGYNL